MAAINAALIQALKTGKGQLVDVSLLTEEEIDWWNDYHAQVLKIVAPQLDGEALVWLKDACAPIG